MKKSLEIFFFAFLVSAVIAGCSNNGNDVPADGNNSTLANSDPAYISYSVLNVFPHDTASFTEGLLIHQGQLYESTGGQPSVNNFTSWFGPVDLKSGKIQKKVMLDTSYFGEGITILKDKIYQLTWEDHIGFVYDLKTFKKLRDFRYNGEGWSLTNDGSSLIMSDGTSNIQYLDPDSLKVQKIISVQDNNGPVGNINELEFIDGFIYANQYLTSNILKIDPASGKVIGKIDFSKLESELKLKAPGALEMNGIAYDADSKKIYVTGKAWPNLYEVRFN